MPDFSKAKSMATPKLSEQKLTKPVAFSLKSVQRHSLDQQRQREKSQNLLDKENQAREFHAIDLPNFEKIDF